MTSPHLDRAMLLLRQSRADLAEQELRRALLDDPQDATAHSLLALCLLERQRYEEATQAAQQAIVSDPEAPFAHLSLAITLRRRNRLDDAATAVREAIRLAPHNSDAWGELSQIELARRNWSAALEAAEHGLHFDPDDVDCTNLRAVALVKLGRREEAGATIDAALARDPDNAFTHANQGWTLLEAGQPRAAMNHFRESLRLDPTSEWARVGIAEAMKARNPLYRWLLNYFLWVSRLDRRVQWGLVIGLWVLARVLNSVGDANPQAKPFILPILVLYAVLVLLTWIGRPLADLLLRLDRFGRHALTDDQIKSSNLVGLVLVAALALAGAGLWVGDEVGSLLLLDALWIGLLLIPASNVYNCEAGPPRNKMAAITGGLAAFAATMVIAHQLAIFEFTLGPAMAIQDLVPLYPWAILGASFFGNALAQQRVRR